MIIDTRERGTNIKLGFVLGGITALALLGFIWFSGIFVSNHAPLAITIIFVVTYIFVSIRSYQFIYYSDEGDFIIFRYFKIIPTTLVHSSIEIKKNSLSKYELKKSFFNLREEIIFSQKTKRGIAKFPPVSIAILDQKQKEYLIKSLNKILN